MAEAGDSILVDGRGRLVFRGCRDGMPDVQRQLRQRSGDRWHDQRLLLEHSVHDVDAVRHLLWPRRLFLLGDLPSETSESRGSWLGSNVDGRAWRRDFVANSILVFTFSVSTQPTQHL